MSSLIEKYLTTEWYSKNPNGTYINADKDFTIIIDNQWKVDYRRSIGRAFWSWGLNSKERLDLLEVANILADK